ncbi:MAG: type II secretion system protein [Gemmatimonadaceae bacterium]
MTHSMTNHTRAAPRDRSGFTLLEVMIVLVIVAILVASALGWSNNSTRVADDTATHADMLRLVASLQEARAESGKYPVTGAFTTDPVAGLAFQPSQGMQYRVYGSADQLSVYAVIGPVRAPSSTCTTALGSYDTGAGTTCTAF